MSQRAPALFRMVVPIIGIGSNRNILYCTRNGHVPNAPALRHLWRPAPAPLLYGDQGRGEARQHEEACAADLSEPAITVLCLRLRAQKVTGLTGG